MRYELHQGDCLESLRAMPDNSVDSIVTDPPYGLAFMGKRWDYDVPSVEIWAECLRVLKPGGHLLAFAGTRTQHRMAVRIEDAGFEIRDMIAWVYGSGFPKSMDVSKAIDKLNGRDMACRIALAEHIRACRESKGVSRADMAAKFQHHKQVTANWERVDAGNRVPSRADWQALSDWLGLSTEWLPLIDRLEAEREVVGRSTNGIAGGSGNHAGEGDSYGFGAEFDITAPATDAARQWQGWGTALKPALEPITVARKPLIGTVAANVLAHGTGAINVDGCRVGSDGGTSRSGQAEYPKRPDGSEDRSGSWARTGHEIVSLNAGRWPANLIHDGSEEVLARFPVTGPSKAAARGGSNPNPMDWGNGRSDGDIVKGHDDNGGSAARFFYCAKASKADRDAGLDGFEVRKIETMNKYSAPSEGRTADKNGGFRANIHPTVKPTDLMRYLCRLVTPPGGTVLDPFMGSGSTGKAAMLEGFRFIGCELSAEYMEIARARIDAACKEEQLDLFGAKQ